MKFNSLEWQIKIGDLFDKCKNEDEVEWLYDQLMAIAVTYLVYTTGIQIVNSFQLYYFTYILGDSKAFSILS